LTIRIGTPLEEIERRVTLATLAHCGHVKRKAADVLGVSLKTLYNRLEAYNGRPGTDAETNSSAATARPALRNESDARLSVATHPADEDEWG
jgi:two-component system response regulator AtoC